MEKTSWKLCPAGITQRYIQGTQVICGIDMKLRMRLRQTGAVTPPGGRKALNVEHRIVGVFLWGIKSTFDFYKILPKVKRRFDPQFFYLDVMDNLAYADRVDKTQA